MLPLPRSCLTAALAFVCVASPAASPFSDFYFFGDSLTDAGSYAPVLPPGTGRFTTNPGRVWAQALGAAYGRSVTPANQGGTDYAYGGARIALSPGYPPNQPLTSAAVPLEAQIRAAVAGGADPSAVYFLWGGANDIFTGLAQAGVGLITPPQLQAQIAAAATQNAGQVSTLHRAGARYVVFLNLPDIGATPEGARSGQSALLSGLTDLYNATALARLDAIGGSQIRFNANLLFKEVLADPGAYGFTNSTGTACGVTPSLVCTSAGLVEPNADQSYVFADGVHPTTAAHGLIAQAVASMLEGPAQMSTLAELPLSVEQSHSRALSGRLWSELGTPPSGKSLRAWVSTDFASQDLDGGAFREADGRLATIVAGIDIRPAPEWLLGVALGYSEGTVKLDDNRGRFQLDEATLSAYGGWSSGPWYVGGSLMLASLDYPSVKRRIRLGAATRTERSDTDGSAYALRAQGGYWISTGSVTHGPFVKLTYQEAEVDGFREGSGSSTALAYDRQERDSLITSIGWQAVGQLGTIRPYLRASWEHEAKADERSVTAHSATLGGTYSIPGYKPDENWGLFELGASADFGGITSSLSVSATTGKDDGDAYAVTLGLSLPL